ncbi:MAG: iron-sulfur cluster assembly scaffold protein [Pseudomonadota bacterium]
MDQVFFLQGAETVCGSDHEPETDVTHGDFSEIAVKYYTEKPYWGVLPDADQTAEMIGSCGDSMTVYLKVANGIITDIRFLVLGCVGAVSAAMAIGDLAKGKSLKEARSINDADVFRVLEEIPVQKHHCIQLAVKTLHAALDACGPG